MRCALANLVTVVSVRNRPRSDRRLALKFPLTVLVLALALLVTMPSSGRILVHGKEINGPPPNLVLVFQNKRAEELLAVMKQKPPMAQG